MNNLYYRGGNAIISLVVLVIVVLVALWLIDLVIPGLGLPAVITTLLKVLVAIYAIFGVINIFNGN